MTAIWVVLAGAIGVLARYLIGTAVSVDTLPTATVAINVVGSLLLGVVVALHHHLSHDVRAAIAVGFCGGFTTFSTFAVDVFVDLEAGNEVEAFVYLAASVVLGVAAAGLGYYGGKALVA